MAEALPVIFRMLTAIARSWISLAGSASASSIEVIRAPRSVPAVMRFPVSALTMIWLSVLSR